MSAARGGIVAVVPVKEFALAKQRLAGVFTPGFRRLLARAMLCDVLAALGETRGLAGFAVISADPQAGRLAEEFGGRWLVEREVQGLNAAVAQAAAMLSAEGRAGMLVLPGDIPAVAAAEIESLIADHGRGAAVSLVPAHDGQGTNALLVSPPGAMAFGFGPMSLARHRAGAEERGLVPAIRDPASFPGVALDVDSPNQLPRLGGLPVGGRTGRLLAAEGLAAAAGRRPRERSAGRCP